MWEAGWRDRTWSELEGPWDLLIIGGGITGAGILREATHAGLRALLLEKHDFAAGTSSRSSKLVHGGFRYLKNGQVKLTIECVHERERLLKEGRGLINPLGFLLATYRADSMPWWTFGIGLTLYDMLALKWGHRYYDPYDLRELCPQLKEDGLRGGYRYFDATTDDARLVIRIIRESVEAGGRALNYARVTHLLRLKDGRVRGVAIQDDAPEGKGRSLEIHAPMVINATGAWADELCPGGSLPGRGKALPRLRKLRGSHLVFPFTTLPLTRSVSCMHPADGRFVFAFPWEGVTVVGTTDVEHSAALATNPAISPAEHTYLMAWLEHTFPDLQLSEKDVLSTYSGIRCVADSGKSDPSKETREHVICFEEGLLTITGGKLTTFRLMAHNALTSIRNSLPGYPRFDPHKRVLNPPLPEDTVPEQLSRLSRLRILGRYGREAPAVIAAANQEELTSIPGLPTLWGELRYAAREEGVVHLDDLLLRRTRLGIQLPEGGLAHLARLRAIAQPELAWDDARWEAEVNDYTRLWQRSYAPLPHPEL
ncbi:MAG: glycerol-3-phosphate dehydrogenase/oxidase [Anaerolineales bacterium]|nr:glycerol-3-phosphate dehydrogenase/oxidase [Anaerolineales bacterium]